MVIDDPLFNIVFYLVPSRPSLLVAPGPINPSQGCYPNAPVQKKHGTSHGWKAGKFPHLPRTPKRFLEPTCLITEDGADLAGTIYHSLQIRG